MIKSESLALLLIGAMTYQVNAVSLPVDCSISGKVNQTESALIGEGVGADATVMTGFIEADKPILLIQGKTGKSNPGMLVTLTGENGEKRVISVKAVDHKAWKNDYPDAALAIQVAGERATHYFVKPNLTFFKPEERDKRRAAWDQLPGASVTSFILEFRPSPSDETEMWVNSQFVGIVKLARPIAYTITLGQGASIEGLALNPESSIPDALALPVSLHSKDGTMANAQLQFDPKAELPAAFRGLTAANAKGIAVEGLAAFTNIAFDDLQSFAYRRHATDGLQEQRMFSVPLATYSHAEILCAVEEGEEKAPSFTLRVTRYGTSRGNGLADTIVNVPTSLDAKNDNARCVGAVSYGPEGNRRKALLWLIKVPIRNGLIQDLLYSDTLKHWNVNTHRYLDIELMDPLKNVEESFAFPPPLGKMWRAWIPTPKDYTGYDFYGSWPEPLTSGVTVFGMSLAKSPASMNVGTNTGLQAFYAAEKPAFHAKLTAEKTGDYEVAWEVVDVEQKVVANGSRKVTLDAGAEGDVAIPVEQGNGWYAMRIRLLASDAEELVDYRTSFVMLPPDNRKAGLESPFYGWWFGKNHNSDVKLEEVGPLLQRLGIRRADLGEDTPESLTLEKYGFTEAAVEFAYVGPAKALTGYRDGKYTLEEAVKMHEEYIRKSVALWPSVTRILVFHESGGRGAPFPSEMWGEPAPKFNVGQEDESSPEALLRKEGGANENAATKVSKEREEWEKNWPKRIEYLTAMSKMVREKFPHLKMQYGNDGASLHPMAELFRQKFPREYIDTIATEDLGQTMAPERVLIGSLHSAWFLRETARKMGYGDIPVTACNEWIGRSTEKLGLATQAEWKVRDGLISLAYGFDMISIAGINDASDAYYYSIWANCGVTHRYPTMAPKPSFASLATLTSVLDQAKYERFIPSGSTVLYVQEFSRGDQWIYAVWTPRGTRETKFQMKGEAKGILTDLYGREKEVKGNVIELTATTGPQYLTSSTRLDKVEAGASAFPADKAPENPIEEKLLDSIGEVSIASVPFLEAQSKKQPEHLPQMREGKFELREVHDPEMGNCIEIELLPEGDLWPLAHEYVQINFRTPVVTDAKNAGIWIKGNGSWGQVNIGANRWGPWASNNNLHMRWPGDATLNFDGWNFISYPYYDWVRKGETTVSGISLTIPRQAIYGTEMMPVPNLKVRIKSVLFY